MEQLHNFYLQHDEPNRSCFLALRDIITKQDDNICETIKWNLPCFCYQAKMFCFLNVEKQSKQPYILFVEGNRLNHPMLEQGDRVRMKIFKVNPNFDLQLQTIELLLNKALELYRKGIIKTNKQ
ncbi:hypothetical protein BZG02_15320 [Labilibaculum filiforme]|uniref:YdhG-like domain-containing protein n=1 Tax=Labilibaculum filiforme TaxID=1940526 RepID=A0A2N3HU49_9BACT|nr:DUF1801 domain-containing protein [Labilibaculum filiforme]PKQ61558.1 hypothetical protein BZG02_15320 [Labilibaculum filiforme]